VLTADTIALPDGLDPGPGSTWANLTAAERARAGAAGLTESFGVGLDVIRRLRDVSGGLPVVVKGVLRADDALRCLDAGAAGVVVSSHGGRRLGPTVPVARALAEVAAAVGDAGEVYADSGLRSGRDVLVALALGARAVFLGRPVLWGLAAEGESGVGGVLGRVTAELVDAMRRVGAADLAALTRDLVVLD
jgi:4-hydroxymandelate oxidase